MADTAPEASHRDWMREHLDAYLSSGGRDGHVVDLSDRGGRAFTTHCLLRVKGRKSGTSYIRPLIYGNVAGELVIVASKGGADENPEWYRNVVASDTVDVQVGAQAYQATWREPEGEERHAVWEYMSHLFPPYIAYQRKTSRHIPLVMLAVTKPIDPFS